jgi:peptide chain release factor 3
MKQNNLAEDKEGRLVFLADSAWALQMAQEQYPKIEFHSKSEF